MTPRSYTMRIKNKTDTPHKNQMLKCIRTFGFQWHVVFILMVMIKMAAASSRFGKIEGTVVDSQGKPIANLQAILENTVMGDVSDKNGHFSIEHIKPGSYTLKLDHIGFKTKIISDLEIQDDQVLNLSTIVLEYDIVKLDGIVVTATRTDRSLMEVSKPVNLVPQARIQERNAKTTAEALREETGIFVQKTNHGGGSAIIRGLSSNQILILVDGIRLNNATYRLGNHQYLTTLNEHIISQVEVVRGPTSVQYGSDAMGGTIHAITRLPNLQGSGLSVDYRLLSRYASADEEKSARAELSIRNKKVALLTGFSYKDFGDLRRGGNSQYPQLEKSTNGLKQSPSGFTTHDFDSKLVVSLSPSQTIILAYQQSRQNEVPRYDQYENSGYERWLYHPQIRNLAYLTYENRLQTTWMTSFRASLSYHRQKEGREIQKDATTPLTKEWVDVRTLGLLLQFNTLFRSHFLTYGTDMYLDNVGSRRSYVDLNTGAVDIDHQARYPDGATYNSFGFFLQDEIRISPRWTVTPGIRYSTFTTHFTIPGDDAVLSPGDIRQTFRSFTGNLGTTAQLVDHVYLNVNIGQAFRAPNLSDISKLGESKGNIYEVPNSQLEPEKMLSIDGGFKVDIDRFKADVSVYYARITDLIASAETTYHGSSTIEINDAVYKVKSKQNIGNAFIRGIEATVNLRFLESLMFHGNATYTYGHNTTEDEPIGGIPPLFSLMGFRWKKPLYDVDVYIRFAQKQDRLSADDLDDPRIPQGGTPGWQTVNIRMGYHLGNIGKCQFAVENIADVNYREHGSGMNGPGRNFILSLELKK